MRFQIYFLKAEHQKYVPLIILTPICDRYPDQQTGICQPKAEARIANLRQQKSGFGFKKVFQKSAGLTATCTNLIFHFYPKVKPSLEEK